MSSADENESIDSDRSPPAAVEGFTGPYSPNGPATPCPSPISAQEIQALLSELSKLPSLQGAWTISADGLPVAILHARSDVHFRLLRERIGGVITWPWNGVFGTLVSFTLSPSDPKSGVSSRMFVAPDHPFVSRLKAIGKAAFAAAWMGKVGPFFMVDLGTHPKHGDRPLIGFRQAVELKPVEEDFYFRDDQLSYWQLMSMPTMHWAKSLSPAETARAAWAAELTHTLHGFRKALEHMRAQRQATRGVSSRPPPVRGPLQHYPALNDFASIVVDDGKPFDEVFHWIEHLIFDDERFAQVVYGLQSKEVDIDGEIRDFVDFGLVSALLGARVTAYGTRKPWLNARNPKHTVQMSFIEVDLNRVGSSEGLQGSTYWLISSLYEAFDIGACISGSDIPMHRAKLATELGQRVLDVSIDEARNAIAALLIEAGQHRKWSVPWGARVQISFGPLKWMDVFELEGEFLVLFRDAAEHYLACAMNVDSGHFSCHGVFEADEPRGRPDIETALLLIGASAVRDFLVVEERRSVLGCRPSRGHRGRCASNSDLSVIYLPRVRYTRPDLGALSETLDEFRPRAAHAVAAHLRKVGHPSSIQLLLAQRYGVTVPTGYTFVRPHRRGDQQSVERMKIYRSRSASALLYEAISVPAGSRPRWFDFERDVAAYLQACGLVVVHQAANRNGDGGIDVYAHHPETDKIVAVQCKCYAAAKKVGPDVVRELKGALVKYPEGTVGRVMTTSSFTDGAIEEAASLGIELVDGKTWAAMLESFSPAA